MLAAYPSLFLSAFGAATFLPLQSEALLVGLLINGAHPPWALILVATCGNVLGSVVNWLLGRYLEHWRGRRWFPLSQAQLDKAQASYHRYGRWSLLLSWMPLIGDPLTAVAGIMREPLWSFVLIVSIAKAGRYLVVAGITTGMLG